MKDAEDEAFDDIARRQGDWGGGYQAKRAMAADKLQEPLQCLDCGSNNVGVPATYDSLVDSVKAQPAQEQCQKHGECFGGECIYPPAQEPVAFAGIEIWVGGARITKHLTQTELHYARDPWMLMQYSAELCLAKLKEKNT